MAADRPLIDISQPVSPRTGAWPGDTPFSARWTWSIGRGDSCNVSAVQTSPHVGSHADAPLHFEQGAPGIGDVELHRYVGSCWVLDGPDSGLVQPSDLAAVDLDRYPRLLLRTRRAATASPGVPAGPADDRPFPQRFVALDPDAARALAARGALLVGLDTPSIDPFDSKDLPSHHILAAARVAILENLVLGHVAPGPYELIALPLRWVGLDASPVRAVLRQL